MDRIKVSETLDVGSIPPESTFSSFESSDARVLETYRVGRPSPELFSLLQVGWPCGDLCHGLSKIRYFYS
jgi:hypothetical protein